MKIEFDTHEILSEEDIRQIATDTVKETFKKQLSSSLGMTDMSFYIYKGLIQDALKDKEIELAKMVNERIKDFKLDSWDIKYHTKVDAIITETIESRKTEFIDKANQQIDKILKEDDWRYRFLQSASEYLQETFIETMYDNLKQKT